MLDSERADLLLIVFMDKTFMAQQRVGGESGLGTTWCHLCFLHMTVLLALSNQDLQHALGQLAAECEASGMIISTYKSEAISFQLEKGGLFPPRWVVLLQVEG